MDFQAVEKAVGLVVGLSKNTSVSQRVEVEASQTSSIAEVINPVFTVDY